SRQKFRPPQLMSRTKGEPALTRLWPWSCLSLPIVTPTQELEKTTHQGSNCSNSTFRRISLFRGMLQKQVFLKQAGFWLRPGTRQFSAGLYATLFHLRRIGTCSRRCFSCPGAGEKSGLSRNSQILLGLQGKPPLGVLQTILHRQLRIP